MISDLWKFRSTFVLRLVEVDVDLGIGSEWLDDGLRLLKKARIDLFEISQIQQRHGNPDFPLGNHNR